MSAWIQHIKAFAAKNNLSYGEALKNPECRSSYKAVKGSGLATKKVLTDPNLMGMIEGFVPPPAPKKKSIYKEREFKKIFKMPVQFEKWFKTWITIFKNSSKEEQKQRIQDGIVSAIETYLIKRTDKTYFGDNELRNKVKKIYNLIKDTKTAPLALLKIITDADDKTQQVGMDYNTWEANSFPAFRYYIMGKEILPITDRETKKLLATL